MIEIAWEFSVRAGSEGEFDRHYGPDGTWVQLFRRGAGYHGTVLLRDRQTPGRYVTLDRWQDLASFERFRSQFAADYDRTDVAMEGLTESEVRLGVFDVV
jgi:heme-degrading monooxygenase HmoA